MSDALEEEKYKILLEQHSKKFDQQISEIKEVVSRLSTELSAVKRQLDEKPLAPKPVEKKTEPTQKVLSSDDKPAVHPRQGNFTPEDVDVKKMFYFGHK